MSLPTAMRRTIHPLAAARIRRSAACIRASAYSASTLWPPCLRCSFASASASAAPRIIRRPIKLSLGRPPATPALHPLVATSPPLPRTHSPLPSSTPSPPQLRPSHFLKQFFLRVHPDLFHSPFAQVHHPRLIDSPPSSPSLPPDEDLQVVSPGVEEVDVQTVDSSIMREVNEGNMAKLNELMGYYKFLRTFPQETPVVAALPTPPTLGTFNFYARQGGGEGEGEAVFTYVSHECQLPKSPTPVVLVQAIDGFLARLFVAGGVPIPTALVTQWEKERRERASHHKYSRMRLHMPWMFDEGAKESQDKQMQMVRRDFTQERKHQFRMGIQERAHWYLQWMYDRGMVKFAGELDAEERMRAMRFLATLLTEYSTQLQIEEWLGSEVWVGGIEEGYAWELGVLKVPWNMTQKEVWKLTQRYVAALRAAREDLQLRDQEEEEMKEESRATQTVREGEGGETGEKRKVAELTDEEVERLLGSYEVNAGETVTTDGDQHRPLNADKMQANASGE